MDSILIDAVINPGNSGGPVYGTDSDGVVGICEAYKPSPIFAAQQNKLEPVPGLYQNAGLAVVIPTEYAIELLKANGVTDYASVGAAKARP